LNEADEDLDLIQFHAKREKRFLRLKMESIEARCSNVHAYMQSADCFGANVWARVDLTRVEKDTAVFGFVVDKDSANPNSGMLHGGCIAMLIDLASTVALFASDREWLYSPLTE
jgi:acyl-coenzyme A thioesterase PaaI-like protein